MATGRKKQSSKPNEYATFVSKLRIKGVGLDSASVNLDRELFSAASAEETTLSLHVSEELRSFEDGLISILMKCEISHRSEDESGKLMSIHCTFSSLYEYEGEVTHDFCQRFAFNESRMIVWPYLRPQECRSTQSYCPWLPTSLHQNQKEWPQEHPKPQQSPSEQTRMETPVRHQLQRECFCKRQLEPDGVRLQRVLKFCHVHTAVLDGDAFQLEPVALFERRIALELDAAVRADDAVPGQVVRVVAE